MAFFCGWCSGRGLVPRNAADLSREEVIDLFNVSTQLNGGRLIVHGLFARADTKNTNGRIYPKAVLKREVKRFKAQHIKAGTALGELNHPSYYSCYFRSLNLPNISHQVLEVHWRGNELWGTIEVLPTPAGLLLWELYSRGIKLGVSSRGWASVVADPVNNRVLVDDDFQLITFDFVTEPSNAGAYLVPLSTTYRKPLPDQLRAVRASYLGFGSSDMASLGQLPAASALSKWMKSTKKAMAATAQDSTAQAITNTVLQQPAVACSGETSNDPNSRSCGGCVLPSTTPLGGGVILGSHYTVLQEPWMPVDPAGRDFKVHLSLVATKAHLMQQKQQQQQQQQRQQGQQKVLAVAAAAPAGPPESEFRQQMQQSGCNAGDTWGMHGSVEPQLQVPPLQQLQQQLQQPPPAVVHGNAVQQQNGLHKQVPYGQQQPQPQMHQGQHQQGDSWHDKKQHQLYSSSARYSVLSSGSMGSTHLTAAQDMLVNTANANTDVSGCSLGPIEPPLQSAVAAAAPAEPASLLRQQQQQRQRVKPRRYQSAPDSLLLQQRQQSWATQQPPSGVDATRRSAVQTVQHSRSCDWDRQQTAAAKPGALYSACVKHDVLERPGLQYCGGTLVGFSNGTTAAIADAAVVCGIPAAAAAEAEAEAAAAAELPSTVHATVQLQDALLLASSGSQTKHSRGAAQAWQETNSADLHASQLQQQLPQPPCQPCASVAQLRQQQPGVDDGYVEIKDTLQAYQSEYTRQKYHLRQEAMHEAGTQ